MFPSSTDVIVVGAGPTGLALAIALHQAGVGYLLIDRLSQGLNASRAAVIHAHTLEALEALGVTEAMVQRGLRVSRFAIRDRNRRLLELDFDRLSSAYRHLLMIPQDVTEKILRDRLAALGGRIHRPAEAVAIEDGSDGATVTIAANSKQHVVAAQYIVGADGMHSIVRRSAGIAFEGGTYEESFVLADVRMRWSLGADEVSLFFSPAGLVVIAPLPNGNHRIVATLENAPEIPSKQDLQQLVDTRGPTGDNRVEDVLWSSRFRLHHRVVDRYRSGRLLLVGDAAHVHSPAGGQGMNTGLVDAVVLGQLLPKALGNPQAGATLDTYGRLRRPAAVEVLVLAGRLTAMATMRNPARRSIRNAILRTINLVPPARRRLIMNLSGLSRKALAQVS